MFKSANGTRQQDTRTLLPTQARASAAAYYRANNRQIKSIRRGSVGLSAQQGGCRAAHCEPSSCSLRARGGARRALEAAHRSVDLLRAGAREGARDMTEAVAAHASNLGHALAVKLVAEA
eukprot:5804479-Prymnesium_polylepis.1